MSTIRSVAHTFTGEPDIIGIESLGFLVTSLACLVVAIKTLAVPFKIVIAVLLILCICSFPANIITPLIRFALMAIFFTFIIFVKIPIVTKTVLFKVIVAVLVGICKGGFSSCFCRSFAPTILNGHKKGQTMH